MILIADSGSTKTQWRAISTIGSYYDILSDGINPYIQTREQINTVIHTAFSELPKKIRSVFYYGAGCGSIENKRIVYESLQHVAPFADIEVQTDLLGAARAVCGKEEGIAAILGTGSNSCYYDGNNIVESHPSLGFILGDEGSGAYIGKQFVRDLLYNEVPSDLNELLRNKTQISKESILEGVYKRPDPNRFLASYVPFLSEFSDHPYVKQLFSISFDAFLDKHISKYSDFHRLPLHCVGSVAFYFKEILSEAAGRRGIRLGTVLQKPIDGMMEFHRSVN